MRTMVHVTETDFEYETESGSIIPILDFGEQSEYYITYGHIPSDEMEEYAHLLITEFGGDPGDKESWGNVEDVTWGWAVAYESHDPDSEFELKWNNITSDTDGAFPVTIISVW